MIGAVEYNKCVTGKRPCDENHVVRFRQSAENRSRAWNTQPIRGIPDELARGCKSWHPLVGQQHRIKQVQTPVML